MIMKNVTVLMSFIVFSQIVNAIFFPFFPNFFSQPYYAQIQQQQTTTQRPTIPSANISNGPYSAVINIENSTNISGLGINLTTQRFRQIQLNETRLASLVRAKRDLTGDILEIQLRSLYQSATIQRQSLINTAIIAIRACIGLAQGVQNYLNFNNNLVSANGINELKNIPNKLTTSQLVCYNENTWTFSSIINEAKSTSSKCLADRLTDANTIGDNAQQTLDDEVLSLTNAQETISDCSSINDKQNAIGDITKNNCLSKGIQNLQAEIHRLPINVQLSTSKIQDNIAIIQQKMTECATEIQDSIIDQAIEISNVISECN